MGRSSDPLPLSRRFGFERWQQALPGGIVAVLGVLLLGVPFYDIWDDYTALGWSLMVTVVENAVFLVLASGIVLGGLWLSRTDWHPRRKWLVTKWTLGGGLAVALLIGWVIYIQLWAMRTLKPYVIAMDGVLIGTTVIFGLGVLRGRTDAQRSQLRTERERIEALEVLHRVATSLQEDTTPTEAYETALDGIEMALAPDSAQISIDGDVVARRTRSQEDATREDASMTALIGDRGRIELWDERTPIAEQKVLDLLGTHLDTALGRVDREQALATERDRFELVNRTLRHDLRNDLNIVQSRLHIIAEEFSPPETHWDVVMSYVERMIGSVERMRSYIRHIEQDDHDLESLDLRSTLESDVALVQRAHEEAEISLGEIPDVSVAADELLGPLFENLLRNAVEHNDKATPEVTVEGHRADGMVVVEVRDNGPGIPEAEEDAIRERGEQLGGGSGDGFGLHLVTTALDTYGGELEIRDNQPTGTVFRIHLPIA